MVINPPLPWYNNIKCRLGMPIPIYQLRSLLKGIFKTVKIHLLCRWYLPIREPSIYVNRKNNPKASDGIPLQRDHIIIPRPRPVCLPAVRRRRVVSTLQPPRRLRALRATKAAVVEPRVRRPGPGPRRRMARGRAVGRRRPPPR